jgi:hypothetical protein
MQWKPNPSPTGVSLSETNIFYRNYVGPENRIEQMKEMALHKASEHLLKL